MPVIITFVLFAAAHGKSEAGRFYLIPQDYDGGPAPEALAKRAIDQAMLQDWLANRIKARKAVILLDTCELRATASSPGRCSMRNALKNGDRNGNGTIELSELVAHVQDQVPRIAAKLNGIGRAAIAVRGATEGSQSARFGSKGEDFALAGRLQ
ncbi:MAG: hypothetical protein F9K29_07485 [Hyphomicrobiaceae bacterium]|nr:MAG: hypothetical protein F9K29_07485 [Hyphomicrobiaceae bacterium]